MVRVLFVLFASLFLMSCANCDKYTRNYVLDKSTHKPIPMVEVLSVAAVKGNQYEQKYHYTDSAGWFETTYSMSGMGKCPSLKITLTKTGYQTLRVVEPQIGDTLFMSPLP
ncbi:MAG: hypothetical protein JST82_05065 [Bacteroidetes bacterium]|nr:hypothetical protein [Bacteroidota bacterium]